MFSFFFVTLQKKKVHPEAPCIYDKWYNCENRVLKHTSITITINFLGSVFVVAILSFFVLIKFTLGMFDMLINRFEAVGDRESRL